MKFILVQKNVYRWGTVSKTFFCLHFNPTKALKWNRTGVGNNTISAKNLVKCHLVVKFLTKSFTYLSMYLNIPSPLPGNAALPFPGTSTSTLKVPDPA